MLNYRIFLLSAVLAAQLLLSVSGLELTIEQRVRPSYEETFTSLTETRKACPPDDGNLLMAAAFNMDPEKYLCGFFKSWYRFSPETYIVVGLSESDRERFEAYTKEYPNVHGIYIKAMPPDGTSWLSWRFYVQRNFLEACGYFNHMALRKKTGGVVISDARDAWAQGDLWSHPLTIEAIKTNSVLFSLEGNVGAHGESIRVRTKQENWNSGGVAMVTRLFTEDNPSYGLNRDDFQCEFISCAGVTVGSPEGMANYLANMCDIMQNTSSGVWTSNGSDQAIHIYLMAIATRGNASLPYPMKVLQGLNGQSPVYNAALGEPIAWNDKEHVMEVIRHGGYKYVPPVMHQFDRAGPSIDGHAYYECARSARFSGLGLVGEKGEEGQ